MISLADTENFRGSFSGELERLRVLDRGPGFRRGLADNPEGPGSGSLVAGGKDGAGVLFEAGDFSLERERRSPASLASGGDLPPVTNDGVTGAFGGGIKVFG